MKETYTPPETEIILFTDADIIKTSGTIEMPIVTF